MRSRSFGSPVSPGGTVSRSSPENKEATNLAITNILGLETINEENNNYIALDVLKSRWIVDRHQQSWTPSPVMTDRYFFHLDLLLFFQVLHEQQDEHVNELGDFAASKLIGLDEVNTFVGF